MANEMSYQRWVALGLLLITILLVVFFAIVPLISSGLEYYAEKKDLRFRLQRYQQIVARKDEVDQGIERIKQQYLAQKYFNNSNTVSLASADIQKFIKNAIVQAGGELTSSQVLPSRSEDGLNRITVKVRMAGDMEVLRAVLYEIENSKPVMIINQIDIRPVRGRRNRKTRRIEPSNKLNVNFEVVGFMRERAS